MTQDLIEVLNYTPAEYAKLILNSNFSLAEHLVASLAKAASEGVMDVPVGTKFADGTVGSLVVERWNRPVEPPIGALGSSLDSIIASAVASVQNPVVFDNPDGVVVFVSQGKGS